VIKFCPKIQMSLKKASRDSKTGFNYIVCLDLLVLACIVVIAGRPDGLAITVSAVIVAALALLYRCTVKVKTYVSGNTRPRKIPIHERQAVPKPPVEVNVESTAARRSWLRDSQ
jgi:hypothetical protein